jgi:hypothetical protein
MVLVHHCESHSKIGINYIARARSFPWEINFVSSAEKQSLKNGTVISDCILWWFPDDLEKNRSVHCYKIEPISHAWKINFK